jgi:hypothetical protein
MPTLTSRGKLKGIGSKGNHFPPGPDPHGCGEREVGFHDSRS